VPGAPDAIYVATASGGVFKSTNQGTTWTPIFDRVDAMMSIGDVAVAPSNAAVVWVGTGEANNRQSSSWGDGVYKSIDGGRTWKASGLADTRHIGRIIIHPTDPEPVYVAARRRQRAHWSRHLPRRPSPPLRRRRSRGTRQRRVSQRGRRRHLGILVEPEPAADVLQPDSRRPEGPQPRLSARIEPRLLCVGRWRQEFS